MTRFPLALAAGMVFAAAPAIAQASADRRVGEPTPARCVRAHAHVPAGKIAHAPAARRCGEAARTAGRTIARASHPRAPLAAPRASRD